MLSYSIIIETALSSFDPANFPSLDSALQAFNKVVNNASNKFIPKGNIKDFNPNFTTEINQLIRQRNATKHQATLTQADIITISELNHKLW